MAENNNIHKHWQVKKLSELIGTDGVFCDGDWIESKDQDINGEIRLIQLADIGDGFFKNKSERRLTLKRAKELNCTFLKKGDILVARMPDPLGRSCIFPLEGEIKYVTAVDVCIIRVSDIFIDRKFLNYIINSPQSRTEISKLQSGSTRKRISRTNLNTIKFPIPPLPEQQAIVSKIEELLSDLENGKQQLLTAQQHLKVYRQSLLKAAFEGKLTNKEVKDGELPKGWTSKKLNEIGTWKGGGTPSKSRKDFWENGDILWVSPKDMKSQKISETIYKITYEAIENSSTKLISKGSVLFVVRSGILRRTLPVALTISDVTVNQDLQALTPKEVIPEYVFWYVCAKNDDIRKTCSKDGTTVESIESSLLKNYSIPICSFKEQQSIIDELGSKLTVCDKMEETIAQSLLQVKTLRQSILKNAFEGKLI